ncbi:dihydroxyacetone kinase subunit DhaL [Ollibium composti]|uniref:Dihydroxyacetone kinase subunit L n=1 Tax=Ollibium composti TaxID=2675109 RepID=A0ABY2Q5Y2_9HYPH|nr:dihydroxyacetone kinase subunit DhaL [Mesorhizobium composti]THF56398.1 dihydroxyacetone kinase subunit L [Mesorhizobium composti]
MTISTDRLKAMFAAIAVAIEADKDRLCALDGVIGDADHGIAMDLGFAAARDATAALGDDADPTVVFNAAAKAFLNAVGASCGPLYATAFMRAGAAVKGKAKLEADDMVDAFAAMAKGIQDRGKAEPGEKTMIDAWLPAAEAARQARAAGASLPAALAAAADAAEQGAEATRNFAATKGRAARLGDRSLGHVDPGAASAVTVIRSMADSLADA